jgi:hypothetical protein
MTQITNIFQVPIPIDTCFDLLTNLASRNSNFSIIEKSYDENKIILKYRFVQESKGLLVSKKIPVELLLTFALERIDDNRTSLETVANCYAADEVDINRPLNIVTKYVKEEANSIHNALRGGQDTRIQRIAAQKYPNYSQVPKAIEAYRAGDKAKTFELLQSELFLARTGNLRRFEWQLLLLSEALEQSEAIARCLLIVTKINPNNRIAEKRLDRFGRISNTSRKGRNIDLLREKIAKRSEDPELHFRLAVLLLSTTPYFLSIEDDNSSYWDGLERKYLWDIMSFSSSSMNEAKEELYIALILGLKGSEDVRKAKLLISDICHSERALSAEEKIAFANFDKIDRVIALRLRKIQEKLKSSRVHLADQPNNALLHLKLALSILESIPNISARDDEIYSFINYRFDPILKEAEQELNVAIALGLDNPLSEARARLELARLLQLKPNPSPNVIEALLHDVVVYTKKHLRRHSHDLDALEIQLSAYSLMGNEKGVGRTEVAIRQANSLFQAGLIAQENEVIFDETQKQVDGLDLEEKVHKLLRAMGLKATLTKASGDGGIDIVAFSENPIFAGKYLVQCKDWANPVGEPVVRDLFGVVVSEGANKGILITTGRFTDGAEQFAAGKQLELIDGDGLRSLLKQYEL